MAGEDGGMGRGDGEEGGEVVEGEWGEEGGKVVEGGGVWCCIK